MTNAVTVADRLAMNDHQITRANRGSVKPKDRPKNLDEMLAEFDPYRRSYTRFLVGDLKNRPVAAQHKLDTDRAREARAIARQVLQAAIDAEKTPTVKLPTKPAPKAAVRKAAARNRTKDNRPPKGARRRRDLETTTKGTGEPTTRRDELHREGLAALAEKLSAERQELISQADILSGKIRHVNDILSGKR